LADIPRAALTDSLALGYIYVAPMGLSVCGFAENEPALAERFNHDTNAEGHGLGSNAKSGLKR
jgi:hypothetical protein